MWYASQLQEQKNFYILVEKTRKQTKIVKKEQRKQWGRCPYNRD